MTNKNYNLANYLLNEVVSTEEDLEKEKSKSASEMLGLYQDMFNYFNAECKKGRDGSEIISSEKYKKMVDEMKKLQAEHTSKYGKEK